MVLFIAGGELAQQVFEQFLGNFGYKF
jgi:hypothetical protein